jgi:hypothetical protein
MKSTKKEKLLAIALLKEKIERTTGKKVVFEKKETSKKVLEEKVLLKEMDIAGLMQVAADAWNSTELVNVAGEAIQKGAMLKTMIGILFGFPLSASTHIWVPKIKQLIAKFGGDAKKAIEAVKNAKPATTQAAPTTQTPAAPTVENVNKKKKVNNGKK